MSLDMFHQNLSVDGCNISGVDHPFNIKEIKYVIVYYTKSFSPRISDVLCFDQHSPCEITF